MAIYPGARKRLIAKHNNGNRRMKQVRRMNLHVAVSEASSLYGFFSGAGVCSHFYVDKKGNVEQYIDTAYASQADLQGNYYTISVETQGGVNNPDGEPWTEAQIVALAKLWDWARDTHGIKNRIATGTRNTAESEGLSWHRLGIKGNFSRRKGLASISYGGGAGLLYSTAYGKVCPGDAKINQIPEIFERAGSGSKPVSNPKPTPATPKPSKPAKSPSVRSGKVPGTNYTVTADGVFGGYTKRALQQALINAGYKGHAVDGKFGSYSTRSLQRFLVSKGYKKHTVDGKWGAYTTRSLQQWLHDAGYRGHAIDGRFGKFTKTSLQLALIDGKVR